MIIYEDLGVQMFSPEKDDLFFLYSKHSVFSHPRKRPFRNAHSTYHLQSMVILAANWTC